MQTDSVRRLSTFVRAYEIRIYLRDKPETRRGGGAWNSSSQNWVNLSVKDEVVKLLGL